MTLSVSGDSITFPDLSTQLTAPKVGMVNRIINGDMRIDQRNAGASVTPSNSYTVDRWQVSVSQVGKLTAQQNAGAITPPTGFSNYLGITTATAFATSSGDQFIVQQQIEGFNTADLAWGTANAQAITLSFRVYSSLTGTFGGAFQNNAYNRAYPFSYSIPVANTWTTVSITIAGDTAGTWTTNNTAGIRVAFGLGVGSTNSGTAGAWAGVNNSSATGATSVVGTSGATFYVTGVQLEKGSTATEFDYRDYGREFIMCQRYLPVAIIPASNYMYAGQAYGTTNAQVFVPFGVLSRVAPTGITTINSPQFASSGGAPTGSVIMQVGSTSGCSLNASGASGFIAGGATSLVTVSAGGAKILFTGCEL